MRGRSADVLHEVVVLGAGPGDADRVGLLEGVVADQVRRHLAGEADDRHAIHQRVGEAGDGVGGAGAGGHQHHADLAGRAGIALGGVHGALLVADQDVAQRVLLEDRVIDRQDGAAGIAEDMLDALVDQGPEHHLRADHFLCCHGSSPYRTNDSRSTARAAERGRRQTPIFRTSRGFWFCARTHEPAPAQCRTPTPETAS